MAAGWRNGLKWCVAGKGRSGRQGGDLQSPRNQRKVKETKGKRNKTKETKINIIK
jgi:hypothetical protein